MSVEEPIEKFKAMPPFSTDFNRENLKKTLVSIEYPGRVINDQEAFRTMGGLEGISAVHSKENRKIELRFRPDDPFCKPTHGEQTATSNLIIKVVKRIKRNKQTKEEQISFETKLEGVVTKTYKFLGLCDFQYLPMIPNHNAISEEDDQFISILEKILPQKLESLDWLKEEAPVFLSPPVFSRMDVPVDYSFRKDAGTSLGSQYEGNVIGRLRKKRLIQTIFLDYNGGPVPTKPREMALRNLTVRFIMEDDKIQIQKLFEKRPIWTKAGLNYVAPNVQKNSLKFILAATAYYFQTGPWRNAWVRLGYDPRQDREARKYQILDFRINQTFKNKVIPKRSYSKYNQPHKFTSYMKTKPSTIRQMTSAPMECKTAEENKNDDVYIYRPGLIPPCRQMFYQYCDLHVPEIQDLLATANPNEICDERYGWYPPQVEDDCRKILNVYIGKRFDELKPKKTSKKKADEGAVEDDGVAEEDDTDEDIQVENFEENNLEESADEDDTGTGSSDDNDNEGKVVERSGEQDD